MKRVLFRSYAKPASTNNVIVSVSSTSLSADTRFYKIADSFAHLGYRSIAIEKSGTDQHKKRLPFEVITLQNQQPLSTGNRDQKENKPPRGRPYIPKVLKKIKGLYLYIKEMYYANKHLYTNHLPDAVIYYLHYYYYFPAVYLKARKNGARIIYDAHDYYSDLLTSSTPLSLEWEYLPKFLNAIERFCIKKSHTIVTVCDSIAKLYQEQHSCNPVVLRNCHLARMEQPVNTNIREYLIQKRNISTDAFIVVVIGQYKPGSDLNSLLKAMTSLPEDIHIAFLGKGYEEALASHESLCTQVKNRLHPIPPVLPGEVVPFVKDADIGLLIYYSHSINYHFALPNGFFQTFSAGLPVLYPDLPEINRIAEKYQLGIQIDPNSPSSLSDAILELYQNTEKRKKYRQASHKAFKEINWENEEKILKQLIGS